MYKCNFPGCKKECKTVQALLAHKRLKHGITGAAVYAETENVQTIEQTTEHVLSEKYFEDPREKLLRAEQVVLRNEIAKLKAEVLESMAAPHHDIKPIREELQNRRVESEEKISEDNLTLPLPLSPPPLPPLPPPPFMETLNERIKRLNERALFR